MMSLGGRGLPRRSRSIRQRMDFVQFWAHVLRRLTAAGLAWSTDTVPGMVQNLKSLHNAELNFLLHGDAIVEGSPGFSAAVLRPYVFDCLLSSALLWGVGVSFQVAYKIIAA